MGISSMERLINSERFLRLRDAMGDSVERRRIFAEAIAETEGVERALWLIIRVGTLLSLPAPPLDKVHADLDGATALAPGDPDVINGAAQAYIHIVTVTQRVSELGKGRRLIPRAAVLATEKWQLLYPLGILDWMRQRYRTAERHLARSLTEMAGWGPDRMRVWSGHRFHATCHHALVVVELGDVEALRRDIAAAEELYQTAVNRDYVSDRPLALAKAGLALFEGDPQGARRELQRIWSKEREDKYTRDSQPLKAEMDLMAARIASAEGNRLSVEHFCQRALERAQQNQLPMTVERIARIREQLRNGMAG